MISKTSSFMLVAVALGAVAPVSATQDYAMNSSLTIEKPNPKADRLKQQAEALYGQKSTMRRAASLHEKEAALRSDTDPRRVEALIQAARLYTYAGEAEHGATLMEQAARWSLQRGDISRGAHALLDAAFMVLKTRDVPRAISLTREADLLALSPLLPAADRVAIVKRIDPSRALLTATAQDQGKE
jgi:hypothetical protein